MNSLIKKMIIIVFAITSIKTLAGETDVSQTNRATRNFTVTVKPYVPFMQGGVDASYRLNARQAVGIHADIDHYLVGGWVTGGVHYKQFVGNSFFVQPQVDHVIEFFHETEINGIGVGVTIGNEWQLDNGVSVGADWLGGGAYLKENGEKGSRVSIPKMRVGYSF